MKKLPYKKFGDNYIRKEIFIVVPILLLFILIALFRGHDSFLKTVLIAFIILIAVAGTIWQTKRLKEFICPNCGKNILEPTIKYRSDGDPINYYCPDCDIEWETGLTESTSS